MNRVVSCVIKNTVAGDDSKSLLAAQREIALLRQQIRLLSMQVNKYDQPPKAQLSLDSSILSSDRVVCSANEIENSSSVSLTSLTKLIRDLQSSIKLGFASSTVNEDASRHHEDEWKSL